MPPSCRAPLALNHAPSFRRRTKARISSRDLRPARPSTTGIKPAAADPGCSVELHHRAHLDMAGRRPGDLRGEVQSDVEVRAIEDIEAPELLFRLDKGSVRGDPLAIPDAHNRGRCGRLEGGAGD